MKIQTAIEKMKREKPELYKAIIQNMFSERNREVALNRKDGKEHMKMMTEKKMAKNKIAN